MIKCIKFTFCIELLCFILCDILESINQSVKSRKRTRNPSLHKANQRKQNVEMGIEHSTKSKKIVPAKIFTGQVICCKKACAVKIPIERQQEIFSAYYRFCNWTTKTLFIRASVDKVQNAPANSTDPVVNLRNQQYIFKYTFLNETGIRTDVCKKFFLKCLQVSGSRVYRAMMSANTNPSAKECRWKRTISE